MSRWIPLPVLMIGTFMIVLDAFIVNVALPSIQTDLHTSASDIEWVVAGYGLTFASFLIMAGRIGDHVGRRRVFSIGLSLFVVASIACGLAPNAAVLIGARLVQGAAGAMISPSALAILGVLYTGADRVRAISVYGITLGLAAVGGQLIGGLLIVWNVAGLGWRAIFFLNVPLGLAALVLARRLVPETRALRTSPLDPVGMTLVTLCLTSLVLPLVEGPQLGWPLWTWSSLGLALMLLICLSTHLGRLDRRGGVPLIDPGLFRQSSFTVGLIAQVTLWCSIASFFFVLALYLQDGRGLRALNAGAVFAILAAAYLATSMRAPALTHRFGRSLIAGGALTLLAGFALLLVAVDAVGTGGSASALAPGLLLVGAGQGLPITPLTTTVLAHADTQQAGAVAGLLSTAQQVGNAVGVAIVGVVFFPALYRGYAHAFTSSLVELGGVTLGVVALAVLLPEHPSRPRVRAEPVAPDHLSPRLEMQ